MKKHTARAALNVMALGLGLSCMAASADELLTRQSVDGFRYLTGEEMDNRSGTIEVHGALNSAPCTLLSNEIALPKGMGTTIGGKRIPLNVDLTGCGYGDALTSAEAPAAQTSVVIVYSALLTGQLGNFFLQGDNRWMPVQRRTVLHGGSSRLTWYLNDVQQRLVVPADKHTKLEASSDTTMRLHLEYE